MLNFYNIFIFILIVFQYSLSSSIASSRSFRSYRSPVKKKLLFPLLEYVFFKLKIEKPQEVVFMSEYNEYTMLKKVLGCNQFFNLVKPLISKTELSWMSELVESACANEWSNVDRILKKREKLRPIILLQLFKNVFSNYLSVNQKKYKPDSELVHKNIKEAIKLFPFDDLEHLEGIFNQDFVSILNQVRTQKGKELLEVF